MPSGLRADIEAQGCASIGAYLEALREARGLSREDVAKSMRVRVDYIEAIEAMDRRRLPGAPYSAGFVRTYAKFLDVDPQAASQAFEDDIPPDTDPRFAPNVRLPDMRVELPRRVIVAGCVGVLALVSLWASRPRGPVGDDLPPPVPESWREWLAAPIAVGPRTFVVDEPFALYAHAATRITVYAADGRVRYMGRLDAGETYMLPTSAGVTVDADNAGALETLYDGEGLGRLGAPGVPLDGWSVDAAIAAQLASLDRLGSAS